MRLGLVLAVLLALPGCAVLQGVNRTVTSVTSPILGSSGSARRGVVEVEGTRFRTRVAASSEDRRTFATSTPGATAAPTAAAEAGRTQAITYCLRTFGGSQIQWIMGPDVEPEQIVVDENGTLQLTGRCVVR